MQPTQLEAFLRRKYGFAKLGHGKHGIEIITKCPVCSKRKLSVNANTGLYQCWHGCISGHVDKLLGDVRAAKEEVAAFRKSIPLPKGVDPPGELVSLMALSDDHQAIQYLKGRNFDPRMLDEVYGLRYCSQGKPYAGGLFNTTNTIIIPLYFDGVLAGWQSRLLYNPDNLDDLACQGLNFIKDEDGDWVRPPKYFTMPGMDKGKMFFNYDWARRSEIVVVCEGVFDAIAVGRCGVAAFGKGVTEHQINLIRAYWNLAVILLDPGDADVEMEKLTAALLKGSTPALFVRLEGYKDAGEAPREAIWSQIDQAIRKNPVLAAGGRTLDTYKFIV